MPRSRQLVPAGLLVLALVSGCSDDGASTRSGSASGSGSGSGSGLSGSDLGATTDDQQVLEAVENYRAYVVSEVDALVDDAKTFTDAVRAGDLEAAKAAYAPSRVRWERIEPIAGLVEEIDGAVDSRVDDFAGVDDPEFTGWHRLEYLLWEKNTTDGGKPFADQLDADLATLQSKLKTLEVPPAAAALGAGELVEEVSKGKITGEEDRYSHTDLWDFAANIEGSKKVVDTFEPILKENNPDLLAGAQQGFTQIQGTLDRYKDGAGYQPYTALSAQDKDKLTAQLAALSETLSGMPQALGLK
jgi:iron uptake system component EfeO